MQTPTPRQLDEYYVFLAASTDSEKERVAVRSFFDAYNRHTAARWGVRFQVLDHESYSTIGIGRPEDLLSEQTLRRFKDSLALVIGIVGQRLTLFPQQGSTSIESMFAWALNENSRTGFPDMKLWFRKVDRFDGPTDLAQLHEAMDQWHKVVAFKKSLDSNPSLLCGKPFTGPHEFADTLSNDLGLWLTDAQRPWMAGQHTPLESRTPNSISSIPTSYYKKLHERLHLLDIAGIDNERAIPIPLSAMYVRLRVLTDHEATAYAERGVLDIQTALKRYTHLVIVGDPGSGKSTFLKYIGLMISRSHLENDPTLALAHLQLRGPLPIPILLSLWDLSHWLQKTKKPRQSVEVTDLLDYITYQFDSVGVSLGLARVTELLSDGACCVLLDGLDEVPTDQGRAMIVSLVQDFVSKYSTNRFVVTSRVRAYTGDTILRGTFVRCDIQDLSEGDRRQFLLNWFALLLSVPRESVTAPGSGSEAAYNSLLGSIEDNDRIKALAVNPLLLTVVAIVHWNRKRLPDQRVDVYDECIDVLLGQRKDAERAHQSRQVTTLDVSAEEEAVYERSWMRKRFSEIALHILCGQDEEVSKFDVVALLIDRFLDRGAANDEVAEKQAEAFLEKQELRSGLLVSRRANSYRFVHLTFQEYLAAWNIANQDFKELTKLIMPHLRNPRWFETLQLLGGELAKKADELHDKYIAYLLHRRGYEADGVKTTSVTDQAPLVALCSNILRDAAGVADIKPSTRSSYEAALRGTLGAFNRYSRVGERYQLEILYALAKLGSSVKEHLTLATKSSNGAVRSAAVQLLVPHLADDDLFNMTHVLSDAALSTVRTYLTALVDRDVQRAMRVLLAEARFTEKQVLGIMYVFGAFEAGAGSHKGLRALCRHVYRAGDTASCLRVIDGPMYRFLDKRSCAAFLRKCILTAPDGALRVAALRVLVKIQDGRKALATVSERAFADCDPVVRKEAMGVLLEGKRSNDIAWRGLSRIVRDHDHGDTCVTALAYLVEYFGELDKTWELVIEVTQKGRHARTRQAALRHLVEDRYNLDRYCRIPFGRNRRSALL